MTDSLRIGTRRSALALRQADYAVALLKMALKPDQPDLEISLSPYVTSGDQNQVEPLPEIGGKGVFTDRIEAALRSGEIDMAVHSLKDLPTAPDDDLMIGAILPRGDPADAWVARDGVLFDNLPRGARIGTSSLRRMAQIRASRPDLEVVSIRGNVPTRLEKMRDPTNNLDGLVLAAAGLRRLNASEHITEIFPSDLMLPAPGQGAIAIQCRAYDQRALNFLKRVDDYESHLQVAAERSFLRKLEAGCSLPVGALAERKKHEYQLTGRVIAVDGTRMITLEEQQAVNSIADAEALGLRLGARMADIGGFALLSAVLNQLLGGERDGDQSMDSE